MNFDTIKSSMMEGIYCSFCKKLDILPDFCKGVNLVDVQRENTSHLQ